MTRRDPQGNRRLLVMRFADGKPQAVPVDDSSVFTVNGQVGCGTFAFEGVESLSIEDAEFQELLKLEQDAFGPLGDLGRPPSEWDRS